MLRIHYTTRALSEIDAQADYLARASPVQASLFIDSVFRQIDLLKTHPRIGRIVPETNKETVRELLFRHYRIIYSLDSLVSESRINVLTVQTGRRPLIDFPER